MAAANIITMRAGADNYIYLLQYDPCHALVVDPGEISPVVMQLSKMGLELGMILVTHHHGDHAGAVAELKKRTGCTVIGGDVSRIPAIDKVVKDGDIITAGNDSIKAIATPGHTRTSICYYMQPSATEPGILWTGDTLFVMGCGRIIEGDAATMYASLMMLAALPDDTLIYCGHDYTEENCRFGLTIEPGNPAIKDRLTKVHALERAGKPTVPSTMGLERETNVFLRAGSAERFGDLRRLKDAF
jgi:hydroxyacylglutathione hydrolase